MRRPLVVLALAVAVALVVGRWVATVYATWAWYDALGAAAVYRAALGHQAAWRGGTIAAAFVFAFLNLYALRRSIVSLVLPRRLGNLEIGEVVSPAMLFAVVTGVAVVLAVLLSAPTGDWTTIALAQAVQPFREMDPYGDRDLAFIMAWLPFEHDLYAWAGRTVVVVSVVIVGLYALTPSLRLRRRGLYVSAWCRRHLAVLGAIAILLLAWRWRLAAQSATTSGLDSSDVFGAFDQAVGLPLLAWLSPLTAAGAFVVFWGGWHGYIRATVTAGLAVAAAGPLAYATLPVLAEWRSPPTERAAAERPFAATRRLFTRRAFGADEVAGVGERLDAPPQAQPGNISAWDPAALERTVLPTGAPSASLGVACRGTPTGIRSTVVTVAGDGASLNGTTFESGLADERGRALPALPATHDASALLTWPRPLVAPGLSGALVVDDTVGHIAAPAFDAWRDRLAHAWSVRSPRLVGAEPQARRPRIVVRRDVRERVQALAPFLTIGPTIVPLVRDDSLYWVAELFTTSRFYPLSERMMVAGALRPYAHHAATAFVHATTGRVLLVRTEQPDAIMRTWIRLFPTLFVDSSHLPPALARDRPPATDWATVQAAAFGRTGIGAAAEAGPFTMATDNADADLYASAPACFAVGADHVTPAWSVPLTDGAGRVAGVVVATGGPSPRTAWVAAPRDERWTEVLDRLQQAADSAGAGRQRRNARRGHAIAIPVASGIAYVQSHYEWGVDAAPTLTGVTALSAGIARVGRTPAEAFGAAPAAASRAPASFRGAVDALYRQMMDALRAGDWTAFGAAFRALGELLRAASR